jgi:hypothetical protein
MFEADTNRTISMIKAFPEIFSFFGNDSNQVTLIAKKVY